MTEQLFATLCQPYIESFLWLGWWAIAVSLVAGLLTVVLDLLVRLSAWWKGRNAVVQNPESAGAASALLDSLKSLIETLVKAPPWFALFLAGTAVVWLGSTQVPQICRPPEVSAPAGEGAGDAEANATDPRQTPDPESGG